MQNWKTQRFINKARKVHGDKYNYDKVVYTKAKNKVIITCPTHGDFEQTISSHLIGKGCTKCAFKKQTKTTEQFILEAKQIHGTQYDYSKTVYVHSELKVIITCPTHGDFEQTPHNHLLGFTGCKECSKSLFSKKITKTTEQFILEAKQIHGTQYDYSKTVYAHSESKVIITCPIHGDFEQTPHNHLLGRKCKKCSIKKPQRTTEQFISDAKQIHGNKYDYSKTVFYGTSFKTIITCPVVSDPEQSPHGDFEQSTSAHLQGAGCPKCAKILNKQKITKTTEQFISKAQKIHSTQYDYSKTIYVNSESKVIISCPTHGDFEQTPHNHLQGSGCPSCITKISKSEQEIFDYIKSIYSGSVEQSNRTILKPFELDIYLPELNVAIEFNGLYWHNENNKSNNYHVQKTNDCEKQNIHLVQIFENEWLHKQEIVKSRLKQILGVNKDKRIYGRQCIIRELDASTERMFMNNNHLQGYVASKVCYGLIYKASNEKEYLVAAMSFGSLRRNLGSSNVDGCYELYRFCNIKNHSVIGGANKLFKHFLKTFKPKKIISFANRRYSFINKNIYQNIGFTFESTTPPSYYYIQGTKLINRFALRKDVLVREYGCPENMTEREFCHEQGWFRIYDAGNLKYVYVPQI